MARKTTAEIIAERRAGLAARIEECTVRTEEALLDTTSALKRSRNVMARADEIIQENDIFLDRAMREKAMRVRKP